MNQRRITRLEGKIDDGEADHAGPGIGGRIYGSSGWRPGWMLWDWGDGWEWESQPKADFDSILASVDCVLLSRVLAQGGFISHWEQAARDPSDPRYEYATKLNKKRKVVFTNELDTAEWPNTEILSGDLKGAVMRLKEREGGTLMVYGGARLVASLAAAGLIDEFQVFVNPTAVGSGMSPFSGSSELDLVRRGINSLPVWLRETGVCELSRWVCVVVTVSGCRRGCGLRR